MKILSIKSYAPHRQLKIIGALTDYSFDHRNLEGIKKALTFATEINYDRLSSQNKILYHYYLSNAWSYIVKLSLGDQINFFHFIHEQTQVIYHLRKAIAIEGFSNIMKERQCQIFTNLGNSFSAIGRFIEAQEFWAKALKIIKYFPMALGNKGNGLFYYAQYLFDPIHKEVFAIHAHYYLDLALQMKQYMDPAASDFFNGLYIHVRTHIPKEYYSKLPNLNKFPLGRKKSLRAYRKWVLQNTLYLNPLNDLGDFTIASHDCQNMPAITYEKKSPPISFTIFNQIKQEFATSRHMFYAATQRANPHYSDQDVIIIETHETAQYSYYIEKLKISFRTAFSIFDKIAFLLNDYLKLGIRPRDVSFREIWYAPSNSDKKTIRNLFQDSDNWALHGLFWLSKDLVENDFDEVMEPEAKKIRILRNHLEHRALKVLSGFKFPFNVYNEEMDISYSISRADLEMKTLKLLKLTRAAILYLSLAINHEEKKKSYPSSKTFRFELSTVSHSRKV